MTYCVLIMRHFDLLKSLSYGLFLVLLGCGVAKPKEKSANSFLKRGEDVSSSFLQEFQGTYWNGEYYFVLKEDGTFEKTVLTNVGKPSLGIPDPTYCKYLLKGKIELIIKRSQEDRDRYMSYATHLLSATEESVQSLDPVPSENCAKFIDEKKRALPISEKQYFAELFPVSGMIRFHNLEKMDEENNTQDENYFRNDILKTLVERKVPNLSSRNEDFKIITENEKVYLELYGSPAASLFDIHDQQTESKDTSGRMDQDRSFQVDFEDGYCIKKVKAIPYDQEGPVYIQYQCRILLN